MGDIGQEIKNIYANFIWNDGVKNGVNKVKVKVCPDSEIVASKRSATGFYYMDYYWSYNQRHTHYKTAFKLGEKFLVFERVPFKEKKMNKIFTSILQLLVIIIAVSGLGLGISEIFNFSNGFVSAWAFWGSILVVMMYAIYKRFKDVGSEHE